MTILPGAAGYTGSTQNGVATTGYGPWAGSYRIEAPIVGGVSRRDVQPLPDSGNLTSYRGRIGQSYYFEVTGPVVSPASNPGQPSPTDGNEPHEENMPMAGWFLPASIVLAAVGWLLATWGTKERGAWFGAIVFGGGFECAVVNFFLSGTMHDALYLWRTGTVGLIGVILLAAQGAVKGLVIARIRPSK